LLKLEAKAPAIVAFEVEDVGSNRGLSMVVRGNDLDTFADISTEIEGSPRARVRVGRARGYIGAGELPEQYRKPMRLLKFFARSALTITLAGIAANANAQSIDELYQAAKKEGALSLHATGEGTPWLWTLAFGHHEDRIPTHGYAGTREAAMMAFA
jgi:hypothetical protein